MSTNIIKEKRFSHLKNAKDFNKELDITEYKQKLSKVVIPFSEFFQNHLPPEKLFEDDRIYFSNLDKEYQVFLKDIFKKEKLP